MSVDIFTNMSTPTFNLQHLVLKEPTPKMLVPLCLDMHEGETNVNNHIYSIMVVDGVNKGPLEKFTQ